MSKIAVIGLVGESIFMRMETLPKPSVTYQAKNIFTELGGKGFNQAVACLKLGGSVSYLGKVGMDSYGTKCIEYCLNIGMDCYLETDTEENTALATILSDESGENTVIVYPGASAKLNKESVLNFKKYIKDAELLVLQYELPLEVIYEAIKVAKDNNVKILLNPAPAVLDDIDLINSVDYLTPNFEECKKIFNLPNAKIEELGSLLVGKYNPIIIVTLGKDGSLLVTNDSYQYFDSFKVEAVDTTGAGDIFNAGLAVSIVNNKPLADAIKFASCASAISVTKHHVLDSIPTYDEVIDFLDKNK